MSRKNWVKYTTEVDVDVTYTTEVDVDVDLRELLGDLTDEQLAEHGLVRFGSQDKVSQAAPIEPNTHNLCSDALAEHKLLLRTVGTKP